MIDKTIWHTCSRPFRSLFVSLPGKDGARLKVRNFGQLWRRRVDGEWQYQQSEPTEEELADWQV